MPELRSVGELMHEVVCPRPSRRREDDQIVELFLHAYQGGRFAYRPNWLPQSRKNVEVIASDCTGTSLAIEHTRVFAFEDHKYEEELLRPIAECLEADPNLRVLDRHFELHFYSGSLRKLRKRHRSLVQQELVRWAVETLPALAARGEVYKFNIPIPLPKGKALEIGLDVKVSERVDPLRPIAVDGRLPGGSQRLVPVVRKALNDKLQKLVDAEADRRLLLLELPTTDSGRSLIDTVRDLAATFPLLKRISQIVVAKTLGFHLGEGLVFFHVWDVAAEVWSDYLKAVIRAPMVPLSAR
jgi:hypothetical protein